MSLRRHKNPDAPRVLRKDRRGANPIKVGLVLVAAVCVIVYFAFAKHVPFTHGFEVKAVFQSAVNIRPGSPVRIAGVDVGKVKGFERANQGDGRLSVVTLEINGNGLPLHKDATAKIRPRIFLEGNWFVDLTPGTPSAPTISSGDTLPVTQTADPVQLDQVLTALQSDTRADLQALLDSYGKALTYEPTAADDVTQDPSVRGKTAAQALNGAIRNGAPALRNAAVVNQALLGLASHDLSDLIDNTGKVTGALSRHEQSLKDVVTNFNRTVAAFADERTALRRSVGELGPTIKHADQALTHLNAALPNLRAFSLELIPGVKETPATIDASYPWIKQTRALLGPDELGGLVKQLAPATIDLAKLTNESLTSLPQADLVSQCISNVILPMGDIKIQDGPFSTGVENYKEFWYAVVGFAGEGQNFDGNGHYVRFASGGGDNAWGTGPWGPGGAGNTQFRQFSRTNKPPLGTRPAYPGPNQQTAYNPKATCKNQPLPNLNGAATGPADGSGPGGVPSTPQTQVQGGATASAAADTTAANQTRARSGSDVAAALVDRLNPFRKRGSR